MKVPVNCSRAAYSAAKAAVNSITCNYRCDLIAEGFTDIHVSLFLPGVVATDFGNNAVGEEPDSRSLPGAQDVNEVADLLLGLIVKPQAELYSRPGYKGLKRIL